MSSVNLNILKFTLTVFLFTNTNSLNIPSYLKPCKFSDRKFEACAVSLANIVLENYRKGDTTLIPAFLKNKPWPFIGMNDNDGVNIYISDPHLTGMDNLRVVKIKKVPGKNRLETVTFAKNVTISGNFSIDVTLDGKTVVGHGKGYVTFRDVHYKCSFEWKLIDKHGDKYMKVILVEVPTDVGSVLHEINVNKESKPANNLPVWHVKCNNPYYKLNVYVFECNRDNVEVEKINVLIFSEGTLVPVIPHHLQIAVSPYGDRQCKFGVDTNVLNENWAEYLVKVMPSAIPYIQRVFHDFTDNMFEEIPYNKLFLE